MDTKVKTAQNWRLKIKRDGIRTPRVRFEMSKVDYRGLEKYRFSRVDYIVNAPTFLK